MGVVLLSKDQDIRKRGDKISTGEIRGFWKRRRESEVHTPYKDGEQGADLAHFVTLQSLRTAGSTRRTPLTTLRM
jgi:hypothetical protein